MNKDCRSANLYSKRGNKVYDAKTICHPQIYAGLLLML